MPIPIAAAIGAGTQLVSTAANAVSQGLTNRANRKFSERMYDKQYSDNVQFWNMQNEYNSPEQQMQRLQDANLNPNMVYGGSSGGTAGTAGPVPTPDVQSVQHRAPNFDGIGNAGTTYLNAMYDYDIKQAQLDNLKKDGNTKLADTALKLAQASATKAQTGRTQFDLNFETEMRSVSADARRELLRQRKNTTDVMLREDERKAAMNASNLQEAAHRILNMKSRRTTDTIERRKMETAIKNLRADTSLKNLDRDLWKQGITRSDPLWMRVLVRHLESMLETTSKMPDVKKYLPKKKTYPQKYYKGKKIPQYLPKGRY